MYYLFILLFFVNLQAQVDITFLVADLKYNERQGVQICEIQPGSVSMFYDAVNPTPAMEALYGNDGLFAAQFSALLARYQTRFWLSQKGPCDAVFKNQLTKNGWRLVTHVRALISDQLFQEVAKIPPADPGNICDYQGIVYGGPTGREQRFLKWYPGIILMDTAFLPCKQNKAAVNHLLTLKPKWKAYLKGESASTIKSDLNCEIYVFKPIGSTLGRGVEIVPKEDLENALEKIGSEKEWAQDLHQYFLVEEFVESDPVEVPHLGHRLYDGTMRVEFLLVYTEGEIKIHFLNGYWQLPRKSIHEEGTLTEKHKSCPFTPYFLEVDPDTLQKVQEQLAPELHSFYQKLLS